MKKIVKKDKTRYFILGILVGLLGGMILGMATQQMIFIISAVEFGESLEGTTFNIEIDINETKLIEGFREVTEELTSSLNNSKGENKRG